MEEVTQRLWQREGAGRLTVSDEQRWHLLSEMQGPKVQEL